MGCSAQKEKIVVKYEQAPVIQESYEEKIKHTFIETDSIDTHYQLYSIESKIQRPYLKKGGQNQSDKVCLIRTFQIKNFMPQEKSALARIIYDLQHLNHLNIVSTKEYYYRNDILQIVQEFYEGGCLLTNLERLGGLPQQQIINTFLEVVAGVNYLHEKGYVHGEIRLDHIMFESPKSYIVKLIDFGIPKHYKSVGQNWRPRNTVYEVHFKSPEQLRGTETQASDIWACGCLLYFLLTSHMPFQGKDVLSLKSAIQRGQVEFLPQEWKGVDPGIIAVIKKILSVNPSLRPAAKDILANTIFRDKSRVSQSTKNLITHNFSAFKQTTEAQSATLQYLIDNMMTERDKLELLEELTKIDVNGDGRLSQDELLAVYVKKSEPETAAKEVKEIFEKIDRDGSGYIDYNEFVIASVNIKKMLNVEKLKKLFTSLDKDHSGQLSRAEFLQLLRDMQLSRDKQQSIISTLDKDGDGQVSLEEFFKLMQNL